MTDILTKRQRVILNSIEWSGGVEGAFLFTKGDRDAHSRASRDVRSLVRRGYLAHNRLTRKGYMDVRRREWQTGNETLRGLIREKMS